MVGVGGVDTVRVHGAVLRGPLPRVGELFEEEALGLGDLVEAVVVALVGRVRRVDALRLRLPHRALASADFWRNPRLGPHEFHETS